MKKSFSILILSLLCLYCSAQDVNIKKKTVYVDGEACLNIVTHNPNSFSVVDPNDELVCNVKYIHNSPYIPGMYQKITFANTDLEITTSTYIFTKKSLVKHLITHKVLDNCSVDSDKLPNFVSAYDENIENATRVIIHNH